MILPDSDNDMEKYKIVFVTKQGKIRRNKIEDFKNIQSNGIIAMKLGKDDEIASVKLVKDEDDILISTYHGKC